MESYRQILSSEFEKRNKVNPRYSLVAFSKQIGLTPSQLHDILKGRYGLSRSKAENVANHLKLENNVRDLFCELVESEHGRSKKSRELANKRLTLLKKKLEFKKLELDKFALISEWYHFAILELTEVQNFKADIPWVAKRLQITNEQVEEGILRLERLGLLKITNHTWKTTEDYTLVGENLPSLAIRNHHKSTLDQAKSALDTQDIQQREYQSAIFSVNSKELPEAKKMLQEFIERFGQRFTQTKNKDAVYNLSLQFFKIYKEEKL